MILKLTLITCFLIYVQNVRQATSGNNFSKFFDLTNESNQFYYIDSLGVPRGKENVGDVWLGTYRKLMGFLQSSGSVMLGIRISSI